MIDRRNFTIGASLAVVVPPLQLMSCQQPAVAASPTYTFMIDGWNTSREKSSAEEVWLRVDRSWRAAWR
jgi:hypothetical protein